jgi:ferredoxin
MRVCPTNIIQPSGLQVGLEGLWTPVLDFRVGTSGCQHNCTACSHVCPTAALRPISLDEKLGRSGFAGKGPIRIGTAFVDHGRCLPWAMDKPCIVCQENCPVSPKAIFVREHFVTVRGGALVVKSAEPLSVQVGSAVLKPGKYATGDYYLKIASEPEDRRRLIVENTENAVTLSPEHRLAELPAAGAGVEIQVRLQRPQVDLDRCIGCGVCEHECPVSGRRAIRVTAENESRTRKRSLLL